MACCQHHSVLMRSRCPPDGDFRFGVITPLAWTPSTCAKRHGCKPNCDTPHAARQGQNHFKVYKNPFTCPRWVVLLAPYDQGCLTSCPFPTGFHQPSSTSQNVIHSTHGLPLLARSSSEILGSIASCKFKQTMVTSPT